MLGKRVRKLRNEKGLTQKDLAKEVGVTDATIGHYEMETRNPPIDVLNRLADFFDVSVDYLLGRTDVPNLYAEKEAIERQKKEMKKYFTIEELEEFIATKRDS